MLPAPTDESMYCDDFGRASIAPLHWEGPVNDSVSVKEEPDDSAYLRIHEGSCSGTFDRTSSVPPHPGGLWEDGRLHVIEVPDAILPTSTDGGSRYGDRGRPSPSQLDLKKHWNNCIVKEEQVDLAAPPAIERLCPEEPVREDSLQPYKEEPGDDSCVPIQSEADEADATSTSEDSDYEDADDLRIDPSYSPEPASGLQTATVGVKKEADETDATSTSESSDCEDADDPSSSPEPASGVQRATVGVEKDPVQSEWEGSGCWKSDNSTQQQLDHGRHDKGERHIYHFGSVSGVSKNDVSLHERTQVEQRAFRFSVSRKAHTDRHSLDATANTQTDEAPLQCATCSKVFSPKESLVAPENIHIGGKPYECDTCANRTVWRFSFRNQQVAYTDRNHFRCPMCPKTFQWKHSLDIHQSEHCLSNTLRKVLPFSCFVCKKKFACWSDLQFHVSTHRVKEVFKHTTSLKAFQMKYHSTAHKKVRTGERPFKCPSCPEVFQKQNFLVVHILKMHSNGRLFTCSTCPRAFLWKHELVNHERIHTNESLFKCPACSKAFLTQGDLLDHEKIHTVRRPFKCSACPKEFHYKQSLTRHKITHQPGCPIAHRSKDHISSDPFSRGSCMSSHERIQQDGIGCKPSTTGIVFVEEPHLNAHKAVPIPPKAFTFGLPLPLKLPFRVKLPLNVLSNYKGKIHKCTSCTLAFTNERHLRAHQVAHTR
ncbi:zinc finger protein 678 isoform X2 [Ixodes scapularis]|nr:zinc finger protein 678 isoform X2 [Ixodes scapularis]